jgi:hypothetical protein
MADELADFLVNASGHGGSALDSVGGDGGGLAFENGLDGFGVGGNGRLGFTRHRKR